MGIKLLIKSEFLLVRILLTFKQLTGKLLIGKENYICSK